MNTYSVYSLATGHFTGLQLQLRARHLADNVPNGFSCLLGDYDHLSERVNLETHQVEEFMPEQPSPQHEWDAGLKRWLYVPSIEERKAMKLAAINRECDRRINASVLPYPETEILTFAKQETEARAFAVNQDAPTPLIDALAANRGIDKVELVSRIIEKADYFAGYVGKIVGYRQKLEDLVHAGAEVDPLAGWPE